MKSLLISCLVQILILSLSLSQCSVACWAASNKTHVETVPTQIAHPDPEPKTVVKSKDGKMALEGAVQKNLEIEALNSKLGFVSRPEGKDQFPAVLLKVLPGSAVAKRGIVAGDKLIGETTDTDGSVTLTMEHAGQGMRFTLKSNELKSAIAAASSPALVATAAGKSKPILKGGLEDPRKKVYKSIVDVLENHDLGLIVDASGSMSTPDCPGNLSRWDWCCQQSQELAAAAAQASSSIDASIFNNNYQTYRHISPLQIPEIFADNHPGGGTEPAGALQEQLENYFNSSRAKPLTIVIVTDGLPNMPMNIAHVLQEESKKIRYQGELTITILLIGEPIDDQHMRQVLGLTPGSSVRNGGFVDIIPFQTTVTVGVKNALFAELKEARLCTDPKKASRASETATGMSDLGGGRGMSYGGGQPGFGGGGVSGNIAPRYGQRHGNSGTGVNTYP